jgi:hypothetical protein
MGGSDTRRQRHWVNVAAATEWSGYFGYFSDPDDYLWKVTTAA